MLRFAVLVLAVIGLVKADNLFSAVALLSLAVAIHQGWSANLFATVSDTVPREAVASVVGIGGMAGALGGVLFAQGTGHILQLTGSYLPLFVVCGSAYLLAWVSMRVLSARVA
jgi:ACS family hexuronate transporter-like MFS transporter